MITPARFQSLAVVPQFQVQAAPAPAKPSMSLIMKMKLKAKAKLALKNTEIAPLAPETPAVPVMLAEEPPALAVEEAP
jgi:hypothetical protein